MLASQRTTLLFSLHTPAPPTIYTLSLHDALPISKGAQEPRNLDFLFYSRLYFGQSRRNRAQKDRKSTRLNSSHPSISYAVFCLKKKNEGHGRDLHGVLKTVQFLGNTLAQRIEYGS